MEQSLDDLNDVIEYLERTGQYSGEASPIGSIASKPDIKTLLDGILQRIEHRALIKEKHEADILAHNQYPLFDLSKIIPDFQIDDKLYNQLTFRETLLISTFINSPSALVPVPVGGLSLDIQAAKGSQPFRKKDPEVEQRMNDVLTENPISTFKLSTKENSTAQLTTNDLDIDTSQPHTSHLDLKSLQDSIECEINNIKEERTNSKFLVHLSSQFNVNGDNGGSRITAWVDRNFHTLEEKRTEFIMENGKTLNEKSLYGALQQSKYYIRYSSRKENFVDKKFYSLTKAKDLICEGASFILMRYLALTKYVGTFELSTMYINGDMCRNIYNCTGPESGIVNDTKLDLCKIYRSIFEECGITHNSVTILTLCGQIVKQDWEGCDYVLQVNPIARIANEKPLGNDQLLLSRMWEKDLQLLSNFLDFKTSCMLKDKSYLLDHPEFKNLMADYVQQILAMKPHKIIDFSINHFLHFVPEFVPQNEYLEEEEESSYDYDNLE